MAREACNMHSHCIACTYDSQWSECRQTEKRWTRAHEWIDDVCVVDFHLNAEFAEPMKMCTWCQVDLNCCILRIGHSVTDLRNNFVYVSMWRPKSSTQHIWRKIQHQMTCVPLMDRFSSIVLYLHTHTKWQYALRSKCHYGIPGHNHLVEWTLFIVLVSFYTNSFTLSLTLSRPIFSLSLFRFAYGKLLASMEESHLFVAMHSLWHWNKSI